MVVPDCSQSLFGPEPQKPWDQDPKMSIPEKGFGVIDKEATAVHPITTDEQEDSGSVHGSDLCVNCEGPEVLVSTHLCLCQNESGVRCIFPQQSDAVPWCRSCAEMCECPCGPCDPHTSDEGMSTSSDEDLQQLGTVETFVLRNKKFFIMKTLSD